MSELVRGVTGEESAAEALVTARAAQPGWAAAPVARRLRPIGWLRRAIAADPLTLARTLGDRRPLAETLSAEVLPLLEAARFLERRAAELLRPRRLGPRGRPVWLWGVSAELRREPCGAVLILAPGNYPLLLPGVQALQALAAGNAAVVKPAPGSAAPMRAVAGLLNAAGLPAGLLTVLPDSEAAGAAAVEAGFDRIVLTGSAATGRRVLRAAAGRLTPCTMELAGNDPVFVLEGADLGPTAAALAYGLRLNGGATCIAPRKVFIRPDDAGELERALMARLSDAPAHKLPAPVLARLRALLEQARAAGARVSSWPDRDATRPIVVANARPGLDLLSEDVFAPVLSIVPVADEQAALSAASICPYALGAAIFGPPAAARRLAGRVRAGSVVINDLIVPTADPRLPFGGRGESGFGLTRGAEGLLEMTVCKTILLRRGRFRPHLEARADDAGALTALIGALHGAPAHRLATLRGLVGR
jgi:acyl-CoA reductase-like NAD-dependent aldehyde dehydrogenase